MGTVQTIAVDSDDMYAVTKQGTQFTLSKASLSQSPEDAINVSTESGTHSFTILPMSTTSGFSS